MKSLGENLFINGAGAYYGRFTLNGRRTWRKLQSIAKKEAGEELLKLQSDHARSKLGLCKDPFVVDVAPLTIAGLADKWKAAGCPGHDLSEKTGDDLTAPLRDLGNLLPVVGKLTIDQVTQGTCHRYLTARTSTITRGKGGARMVDVELNTLSNLLHWSAAHDLIKYNPVSKRPRFCKREDVRNCNLVMPESDEELHKLANFMFRDERGEALGWQLLLEALTGCRTSEILRLRWDARKVGSQGEPGFIDDTCLYIERDKRGIEPWILLDVDKDHSPLRELLRALRHWHAKRHPASVWFLPGRDPSQPLNSTSLTHALEDATAALKLPHRTSHGMRAFFVRALRSLGVVDTEISMRMGHQSGVGLIERTYGRMEPGWFGSKRSDFLPDVTGQPSDIPCAWSKWLPETASNIIPMQKAS